MWPGDMNDVQLQSAQKYLTDNTQAIQAIRDAANKPYFWMDYENPKFKEVSLIEAINYESGALNVLEWWRQLAYTMVLNIKFDVFKGAIDEAISDCFAMKKISLLFQSQGFLVEQLTGIAIEDLVDSAVLDILNKDVFSIGQLLVIQKYYSMVIREYEPIIDFVNEKVCLLDLIQRSFNDNGKGDGRLLSSGLLYLFIDAKKLDKVFSMVKCPSRKEIVNKVERFYDQEEQLFKLRPLQQNDLHFKIDSSTNVLGLKGATKVFMDLYKSYWRLEAKRAGFVTIMAVKRYQLEKGQFPDSLQQVVEAGYLEELPMDPFNEKPLGYKVVDDDFLLYSIGADFKDDGGKKVKFSVEGDQFTAENGDYIFWPTQKI